MKKDNKNRVIAGILAVFMAIAGCCGTPIGVPAADQAGESQELYTLTIKEASGGRVTVAEDGNSAGEEKNEDGVIVLEYKAGTEILLTAEPDSGYATAEVTCLNEKEEKIEWKQVLADEQKYLLEMPACNVTVQAVFNKKETASPDETVQTAAAEEEAADPSDAINGNSIKTAEETADVQREEGLSKDNSDVDSAPANNIASSVTIEDTLGDCVGTVFVGTEEEAAEAEEESGEIATASLEDPETENSDDAEISLASSRENGFMATIVPDSTMIHYYNWSTCMFTVLVNGSAVATGMCTEPGAATSSGTAAAYIWNDDVVKALMLCLPGGAWSSTHGKNLFVYGNDQNTYALIHAAVSYRNNTSFTQGLPQSEISEIQTRIANIEGLLAGNAAAKAELDEYTLYIARFGDSQDICWIEHDNQSGGIAIEKKSANTNITADNREYSLKGAEFTVYKGGTSASVGKIVTDKDGKGSMDGLAAGTYDIVETKAPEGYLIDSTKHSVTVTAGATVTYTCKDAPGTDNLNLLLVKRDSETGTAQGNAALAGAQYTVKYYDVTKTSDPAASGEKPLYTWVFKTGDDGKITLDADHKVSGDSLLKADGDYVVPLGTLTIQETSAPAGYLKDDTVYVAETTLKSSKTVTTSNLPNTAAKASKETVIRGGVKINKRDWETKKTVPLGGATLAGAVFEIVNESQNEVLVDGTLYQNGETVTQITTNAEGLAETADDLLPYGTYRIREVQPPEGYTSEGITEQTFTIRKDREVTDLTAVEDSIQNRVKRGDLTFIKVNDSTNRPISGVPFTITSKTTGESHTIMSDVNGKVSTESSWNLHTANTNRGESCEDGVWFGIDAPVRDDLPALPYDTYLVEEQSCENNKGLNLVSFEVRIYKDLYTVDMEGVRDTQIEISTTASNHETGLKYVEAKEGAVIEDQLSYSGLIPGEEYTIEAYLVDSDTGEKITNNGAEVTVMQDFTPENSSGKEAVLLTVDTEELAGKTVTVMEKLYRNGQLAASHEEKDDKDQMVYITDLQTSAKDGTTGEQTGTVAEEASIIDTVSYKGLIAGKKYRISGKLMDKETGKPFKVNGMEVTAEQSFTAEASEGSVDMTFTFDASGLQGKTLVVFENLYAGSEIIAAHENINDVGQSIYYPVIKTQAADETTGTHQGTTSEMVTLIDTVTYENLVPGKEYKICGTLMVKETGEELTDSDGNPVVASEGFTPEESSGTAELIFSFDSSLIAGETVVAFEDLYYRDICLVTHADLEDKDQSVYYPALRTTAIDQGSYSHNGLRKKEEKITDTVMYSNVIEGNTYTVKGTLMVKETGKTLLQDGQPVTAETTFTAENTEGFVQMDYIIDSRELAEQTVVVFEDLLFEETTVAAHEDLEDTEQSIRYPKISTKAEIDGKKEAAEASSITVTDTVTYSNLTPFVEYTMKGVLMEKSSGKVLQIDGKNVLAETSFIPEEKNGTVQLTFTFNAEGLGGKSLVAFEALYEGDTMLTDHRDIEDEDQTVKITEVKTTVTATPTVTAGTTSGSTAKSTTSAASAVKTGDDSHATEWVIVLLGAIAVLFMIYRIRKDRVEQEMISEENESK